MTLLPLGHPIDCARPREVGGMVWMLNDPEGADVKGPRVKLLGASGDEILWAVQRSLGVCL